MSRYLLILVLAAASGAAVADPAASQSPPAPSSAWTTGTRPRAPTPPAQPSEAISLRVYEGFSSLGPVYGHRGGDFAVDVNAEMATCPDGSRIVTALLIGGARYVLDNSCSGLNGRKPVDAGGTAAERPVIRCSAGTWNCRQD